MIITFYSYKGGVGRSMALANIAALFARAGLDVVVIDWDLEAPGIERFFTDDPAVAEQPGLIDLLRDYRAYIQQPLEHMREDQLERIQAAPEREHLEPLPSLEPYIQTITLADGVRPIRLITAGQRGKDGFTDYVARVRSFDWEQFYNVWEGERFFEWLRDRLELPERPEAPPAERRAIVLIDSRTGVSEMNSACTMQLADVLVALCAPNRQNLDGLALMVENFQRESLQAKRHNGPLEVIVVPSRVAEEDTPERRRFHQDFQAAFGTLRSRFNHGQAWDLSLPYAPRYAVGDVVAIANPAALTSEGRGLTQAYARLGLMLAALSSADDYSVVLAAVLKLDPTFSVRLLESQPHLILQNYLQALLTQLDSIPLGVSFSRQGALPHRLSEIYIEPSVVQGVGRPPTVAGAPSPAPHDLSRRHRVVLLGDPGAGKSTSIRYEALRLARATLRGRNGAYRTTAAHAPVPLLVPLHDLAERLRAPSGAGLTSLWAWAGERYGPELGAVLQRAADDGRLVWLFDGLDEVVNPPDRRVVERVVAVIEQVAAQYPRCRMIVTCRTAYYQHYRDLLVSWHHFTLCEFSAEQQNLFLRQYFRALAGAAFAGADEPHVLANALSSAIDQNVALRQLAQNPLLLTIIAVVFLGNSYLPDLQTSLYEACVDVMLYQWRPLTLEARLRERLRLDAWTSNDTGALLDRLAFAAHGAGEAGLASSTFLSYAVAFAETAAYLAVFDRPGEAGRADTRARAICDELTVVTNGLIQEEVPGQYRFLHRTIQEYLAARRLVSDVDWPRGQEEFPDRALELLRAPGGDRWREVMVMAGSYLAQKNQVRPVAALVQALLTSSEAPAPSPHVRLSLAAELLVALRRERLARLGQGFRQLWDEAAGALVTAFSSEPGLSMASRVQLGSLLGQLGDPRPGVLTVDPAWQPVAAGMAVIGSRLREPETWGVVSAEGPAAHDAEAAGSYHNLAPVPGMLVHNDLRRQTVAYGGFAIARYPVTNAQWRHFLDDPVGYGNAEWWQDGQPRPVGQIVAPAFWGDARYNGPNQPVVGVSWHEASAFCRWLSTRLRRPVMLPTEQQWEIAARGPGGAIYPWGDQWEPDRANTSESTIGQPSPVGAFPMGDSHYGAADMLGNVLEWTSSPFRAPVGPARHYRYRRRRRVGRLPFRTVSWSEIAVRGGSWLLDHRVARCAARFSYPPESREWDLGFRVVTLIGDTRHH